MPYAQDYIGIYKIRNVVTGKCYIGQSQHVKKRVHEHFRLLAKGCHVNRILQNSYNKYGKDAFDWALEVECADIRDLDDIENAFLQGNAAFDEPTFFNIADVAKVPMRGKQHTQITKDKISASKMGRKDHITPELIKLQKERQQKKALSDPKYLAIVKFIVDNPNMSYAERGRVTNRPLSTARKIALKYNHLKGNL